ncbi:MAG TPA: GNAT family N-acetyltransferase [Acetobacteraceae bacterium]|nr:GNAT family N-acetyltransferase [Acetobacteraceae bacterium]
MGRWAEFEASWEADLPAREVEARWLALEAKSDGSFFQSWAWTGCLYDERFPRPVLLTLARDGECRAIALFNRESGKGGDRLLLGESGVAALDSVFIEHNGPLVARDAPGALEACFDAMTHGGPGLLAGRRVILSGIGDEALAAARRSGIVRLEITRSAPAVDLARLRRKGQGMLDDLSATARYQLRRSVRRYEMAGPLSIRRADTVGEAERFLAALAELHGRTWRARGRSGAFAEPAFRRFHGELIGRGLPAGMVDLLEIAAGPRIIGYLLNFVFRNHVYAYQSGFDYELMHPHEKPGLTCHYTAIQRYLEGGLEIYDFLAGHDRYKESFSDHAMPLYWARLAPRWSIPGGCYGLANLISRLRAR